MWGRQGRVLGAAPRQGGWRCMPESSLPPAEAASCRLFFSARLVLTSSARLLGVASGMNTGQGCTHLGLWASSSPPLSVLPPALPLLVWHSNWGRPGRVPMGSP